MCPSICTALSAFATVDPDSMESVLILVFVLLFFALLVYWGETSKHYKKLRDKEETEYMEREFATYTDLRDWENRHAGAPTYEEREAEFEELMREVNDELLEALEESEGKGPLDQDDQKLLGELREQRARRARRKLNERIREASEGQLLDEVLAEEKRSGRKWTATEICTRLAEKQTELGHARGWENKDGFTTDPFPQPPGDYWIVLARSPSKRPWVGVMTDDGYCCQTIGAQLFESKADTQKRVSQAKEDGWEAAAFKVSLPASWKEKSLHKQISHICCSQFSLEWENT